MGKKRATIMIDGVAYPVIDRMGFQHSLGMYAVEVETPEGERIAVSTGGRFAPWKWHRPIVLIGPPPCGQSAK